MRSVQNTAAPPALDLRAVGRTFGSLRAVADVTLAIASGERRAILGPNGAGKTTLFNTLLGDFPPTSGTISLFGEDITRMRPQHRIRRGMGRTYQTSLLFDGLNVEENLYLAVRGMRTNRLSLLRPRRGDVALAQARATAERMRISHLLSRDVSDLSHGQRRQVEIGMALAAEPKVLMLDEPAAGLSAAERPELNRILAGLPRDLTLVLIEHDMDVALRNADMVTVMKDGRVVAEDLPCRISDNAVVREIYLGGGHH